MNNKLPRLSELVEPLANVLKQPIAIPPVIVVPVEKPVEIDYSKPLDKKDK